MLSCHILLALIASVVAVPLNINLGSYSPALIVGDGEISFSDTQSASELMQTLETGSTGTSQSQGQKSNSAQVELTPDNQKREGEQDTKGEAAKRAPNLRRTLNEVSKKRSPVEDKMDAVQGAMNWIKRDLPGFQAALNYANEAIKNEPLLNIGNDGVGIVKGPGANNQNGSGLTSSNTRAKRSQVIMEEDETPKLTVLTITEV